MTDDSTVASKGDRTLVHTWLLEEIQPGDAITKDGLENIASHKYKPGQYTKLDLLLNDSWAALTEMLPLWLAPNMVTTLGGMLCGLSYATLWFLSPNLDVSSGEIPDWAIALAGLCTYGYYTLDCMDGKQARRTGTSSPLGQLFDHGFDCICNLFHISAIGAIHLSGGSIWFLLLQVTNQFAFYCAQWEEYYTHVLPHAHGDWIGVTEVNYGIGTLILANAFIDRRAFWEQTMGSLLPAEVIDYAPNWFEKLELRQFGTLGWFVLLTMLVFFSVLRVYNSVRSTSVFLSAVSKLISPALLIASIFLLPPSVIVNHTRYVSVCLGLIFSLITKKMIVYSMAKMTYASIQIEIIPFMMLCIW
eukprot:CAMPEP_0116021058 /NCGR_PEP_ID=MMETSP0321-20121206/10161_1 /TAXON_ID=163516 /ORGANISM="Leptocylindrus danicus var. danicus, Strain B650" /LENGTH=359 /DNA_ID=CAMNT_0003491857 /DNA_START=28 /DNA_END=1104 /DNA_ORIENTATION=+